MPVLRARRIVAYASDLDGVLTDSRPSERAGWTAWARRYCLDPTPFIEAHGLTAVEKINRFAGHLDLDVQAEAAEVAALEAENVAGVVALPGAAELLALSLPLAIVTSSSRTLALARLQAAGLTPPPILVTAESVPNAKPHPDPYVSAARQLGVPPGDCVALEDAPPGMASAHSAGMRVVALTTTHPPTALAGADLVVDDLAAYLRDHARHS